MYTEYQTRASLIKTLNLALEESKVTGFKVMARNPQLMAHADRVVLLDRLYVRRIGWQSHEYLRPKPESVLLRKAEVWLEEVAWQISVLRKRQVSDSIDTMTGSDVVNYLVAWFNSHHGAAAMRGRTDVPMAPVLCKQVRLQTYSDDSDIHQVEGAIDLKAIIVQSLADDVPDVKSWEVETYPI